MRYRLLPAFLVVALAAPHALAIEDEATGLRVELGDEFVVEMSTRQRPDYQALIGVNTASGEPAIVGTGDYLCEVGFQSAPQNAGLTQLEINAAIDAPGWRKMAQRSMEAVFAFDAAEKFEQGGIVGYEFIATPKMGPDAANVRVVLSMLETPNGRTVVSCAATANTVDDANAVFRTVRAGVTPP